MFKRLAIRLRTDRYLQAVLLLFFIGAFLRIYRFAEFVTFLGDQGRDAIIVKRILAFQHFPAIGAPTSVGQIYLGPFYYYFIAPWLGLFRFDPIGLAYGVAFFSVLYIPINYFIVKKILDQKTALISTFLITFSTTLIDFSRFSWNPNLLPLFSLLTVYFFIIAFTDQKNRYFALGGAFLSFSIQLHYLALFLVPAISAFIIKKMVKDKKHLKKNLIGLLICKISFLFFSIPLIIFDLRHQFLNTKGFISLFSNNEAIATSKIANFINTGYSLDRYTFALNMPQLFILPFLLFILFSLILIFKKEEKVSDFFLIFFITALGFSFYGGQKFPHYFGAIYPFYYITAAYLVSMFPKKLWGRIMISLFIGGFILLNSMHYSFFWQKGLSQVERARKHAKIIYDHVSTDKYTLTAIPEVYSDHTSRYFLEIWNKKPQDREDKGKTNELFVICEKSCNPLSSPLYDIAYFAPSKISNVWKSEDVMIYKLIK